MSKILVTQLVGVDGREIKNLVNSDSVERAAAMSAFTARDYEMLQISTKAGAYLKMQSGDVIYIKETFEWYTQQEIDSRR